MLGEDVGHYGGSYKVTYDLYKKFGDMRVLDTPICGERLPSATATAAVCPLRACCFSECGSTARTAECCLAYEMISQEQREG